MSETAPISRRQLLRGRFFNAVARRTADAVENRLESISQAGKPVQGRESEIRTRWPAASQPPHLSAPEHHDSPRISHAASRRPLPILRPPGAIDELSFLFACTRCDACAAACPHQAIVPAAPRFRQAAGTPMIDPATSPCHMCPDTPCISACEPRVLRREQPLKIGTAIIQTYNCLAHNRSFCTTCSERCPIPGAVILIDGKPKIDPDACTGCGICHYACPAPINAIMVLPLADRPAPPRALDLGYLPGGMASPDDHEAAQSTEAAR